MIEYNTPIRKIVKPSLIDEIANYSFAIKQDLELLRSDADKLIKAANDLKSSISEKRQEPRTR